jgi:hypothetical protein
MFKYIIRAQGQIAFPVHSELTFLEFEDYIRSKCKRCGKDRHIEINHKVYVNPEVMLVDDFANYLPLTMGLKSQVEKSNL